MFILIKQVFIALLTFSRSLETKCVSLNNEPCVIRYTAIDLNHVGFSYCPFMIGLDKCNGRSSVVVNLSAAICVLSETEDASVKLFNIVTGINEVKTLVKHISFDCKCKFDSTTCY